MNLQGAILLSAICAGALAASSAELPTNRPMRKIRQYSSRVNFQDEAVQVKAPEQPRNPRLPDPLDEGPGLTEQLPAESMSPRAPPAPMRTDRTRASERPSWSLDSEKVESKESGWGWLADEVNKSARPVSMESSLEADPADEMSMDDPEDANGVLGTGPAAPLAQPLTQEAWRPSEFNAPVQEDSTFAPSMGGGDWRAADAAARNDLGAAQEAVVIADDNPARSQMNPGPETTDLSRRIADLGRDAEQELALPGMRPAGAGWTASAGASWMDKPTDASASAGGGSLFEPRGEASLFSTMGAVDIQPTISPGASVSPLLTLPGQAPEKPSINSMGSEMQARPATLSW